MAKDDQQLALTYEPTPEELAFMAKASQAAYIAGLRSLTPARMAKQTLSVSIPLELWEKLKLVSKFREISMGDIITVASTPLIDKLYADLLNDYRATVRDPRDPSC